jgi:3-oxoacyl-(acyl-carrier-protein) synthase
VTTLGWSARETAQNLIAGRIIPAAICISSHLLNRDFKAFEVPYDGNPLDKSRAMIGAAMNDAISCSGLSEAEVAESSLLVGTTGGLFIRNEYEFTAALKNYPHKEAPAISCRNRGPGEVADLIAAQYGIKGLTMTFSMACVSSSHALVVAAQLLEQKKIKRAIIIGFEPLLNLTLQGFASLLLYDQEQCRPFCLNRSGMQIGEGAAVVILEQDNSSSPGGKDTRPHSVEYRQGKEDSLRHKYLFSGGYLFNDMASLTSAGVDGELVKDVILNTLNKARVSADEIVAIKAHGTGTRDNDLSEGRGIVKVFGEKLPPVVSLKGALGHGLGAAGAVETAVWLSCLEEGTIPRSFGFGQIDPEIGFAPAQVNTPARNGAYLFTYFGFGGTCTSYVIIKNNI